jgi:phosphoglycolate phosphatase
MTIRHVFLDLDGTLTDSRLGITLSIQHALRMLDHEPPEAAALERYIGPPLVETFTTLLGDEARAVEALGHYRDRYTSVGLFENEVYDGVPEMLEALIASDLRLYLATAKPHAYAGRIVEHFGISPRLERVFGPELDGTRNDKAELLAHALAETGIDPATAAMVGDRSHDIRAGLMNAVRPVGVLWGYGGVDELRGAGADAIIAEPGDLAPLLAGWTRGSAPVGP